MYDNVNNQVQRLARGLGKEAASLKSIGKPADVTVGGASKEVYAKASRHMAEQTETELQKRSETQAQAIQPGFGHTGIGKAAQDSQAQEVGRQVDKWVPRPMGVDTEFRDPMSFKAQTALNFRKDLPYSSASRMRRLLRTPYNRGTSKDLWLEGSYDAQQAVGDVRHPGTTRSTTGGKLNTVGAYDYLPQMSNTKDLFRNLRGMKSSPFLRTAELFRTIPFLRDRLGWLPKGPMESTHDAIYAGQGMGDEIKELAELASEGRRMQKSNAADNQAQEVGRQVDPDKEKIQKKNIMHPGSRSPKTDDNKKMGHYSKGMQHSFASNLGLLAQHLKKSEELRTEGHDMFATDFDIDTETTDELESLETHDNTEMAAISGAATGEKTEALSPSNVKNYAGGEVGREVSDD